MKFTKTLLIAAVALLLASPSAAGNLRLFGSYWNTEDADEAVGFGVGTRLGRYFDLRATYYSDVTADTTPEHSDFEIQAIPLEAGFVFPFAESANFNPYAGGGVSLVLLDIDGGEVNEELGFYGVLGAEFGDPDGVGFFAEAMYRQMEAKVRDDDDFDDVVIRDEVETALSGFAVNGGVVWRF